MSTRRRRGDERADPVQGDLFSVDPSEHLLYALEADQWPAQDAFPFNRAGATVRSLVRADLGSSPQPLIVAGYSSIAELVDFVSEWEDYGHDGVVRVLLGNEPYPTTRYAFAASSEAFTEEVRRYWEAQNVSVRLSAKVIRAIEAIGAGRLCCRFIHGAAGLHAKVYVGRDAATVGSSNFTPAGLATQIEANARFQRASEHRRYEALATIAENLWARGEAWDDELRTLLQDLLRMVGWQEVLARACVDLLEGEWAARYLEGAEGVGASLWPSQRSGIAQALWIIETVGSVLVADATGSGKTRMGAHLVRAVRDRLWSTGRVRRDMAAVVCPPSVERTWLGEANVARLNIQTVSHGKLSRAATFGTREEEETVSRAQILAVDEAHNFLNPAARRTRQVRESGADHVLLFTATPINRGAADLLQLIGFLGPDNFEEATLDVLRRLDRRRSTGDPVLSAAEVERLRREIQRFTVRRTKTMLNELVDRDSHAYIDPDTGTTCRYPRHDSKVYDTGETPEDEAAAERTRALARELMGIAQLEQTIAVPAALRGEYTDERWLEFRLASVQGLAAHHVLGAMRSSRAAVVEHLAGTEAASERFGLSRFKTAVSGDVIGKLERLAERGPPEVSLECDRPGWLSDVEEWRAACGDELARYRAMLAAAAELSAAREQAKARLLAELARRHDLVLAFDRHPITLEQLRLVLGPAGSEVLVATGASRTERRRVEEASRRGSSRRAIALCSDVMSEGLNLQGAAAIVHLDLPTTLRVAEQRVGRVDRMNSPHAVIEAWWPRDGVAFATRADELLLQRAAESEQLLGSNLQVPLGADRRVVDVEQRIAEAEAPEAESWDGIRDALEPVRTLISGEHPLVAPKLYNEVRGLPRARVISMVESEAPWAFLAVAAGAQGAPRWLFLDGPGLRPVVGLEEVAAHLRSRLAHDPGGVALEDSLPLLDRVLDAAGSAERMLLPRRMQRALDQLATLTRSYAGVAQRRGEEEVATRWGRISALVDRSGALHRPDPYGVAERWLRLTRPYLDAERARRRQQPFVLLRDIDRRLRDEPLGLESVEAAFGDLTTMAPLDERVVACILGVPGLRALPSGRVVRPGPSQ